MVNIWVVIVVHQLPKKVLIILAVVSVSQRLKLIRRFVVVLVVRFRRKLLIAIASIRVQFPARILNIHALSLQIEFKEASRAMRMHTTATFAIVARHRANSPLPVVERISCGPALDNLLNKYLIEVHYGLFEDLILRIYGDHDFNACLQ